MYTRKSFSLLGRAHFTFNRANRFHATSPARQSDRGFLILVEARLVSVILQQSAIEEKFLPLSLANKMVGLTIELSSPELYGLTHRE